MPAPGSVTGRLNQLKAGGLAVLQPPWLRCFPTNEAIADQRDRVTRVRPGRGLGAIRSIWNEEMGP
jgi:hypothetical protein